MRRLLLLLFIMLAPVAAQAQVKITALPSGTPATTDVLPFVANPSGTATTKKTTVADLLGALHTTCATNQFASAISVAGVLQCSQPSFSNLSGTISTGQQPSTTVNSVVNDTNIQGSIAAQALTFSWAGALAKARQHSATVYNDQANSWSTGAQDMSAATSFKAPSAAGYAGSSSGTIGYDTTANRFSGGVNGVNKLFVHPDSTDTLTNKTISGASNTLTNIGNSSLTNSTITIQGSAVALGGSALSTTATPQFLRLGLNQAADANAPLAATGAANNITLFQLKRNTDTSPTGNFSDFQNAAGASLWKVDITGSLAAGTVPNARVSGLAASATTDTTNASNITSGTLPNARLTAGQFPGTTTNDNATAGNIGEYVEGTLASGSAISLTTGTQTNVVSISLTAGDWDVFVNAIFHPGATTTINYMGTSASSTSATMNFSDPFTGQVTMNSTVINANADYSITSRRRLSLSATTTVYLVVRAGFGTSTLSAYGGIFARRMR